MYKGINVPSDHANIITSILKLLPLKSHVWVFGSRLKPTIKPFADLDLAIDCNQKPLSFALMADLRRAFEESSLPYKVDIVDMNTINSDFLNIINQNKVPWDFNINLTTDK
ncbi:MAG: nucleotidyltransferase domain-containing protein [Alphaproteobacteria bacterium]|nr:nucleotidyltransferase domain-containing protein [Alphaproteobacteria bacterium]